jgi:hypothetical protein
VLPADAARDPTVTRERAEELLAEKGWRLDKPAAYEGAKWWVVTGPHHEKETIATGSTWREAVSNALGIPAF